MTSLTLDQADAIQDLVTIKDRDPETMTEHDYDLRNALAELLFGTISLHDAFSHKHPEFCLSTVIWLEHWGWLDKIRKRKIQGKIYSSDGITGAAIRIHPKESNLAACLADASYDPNGIYLYFDGHSNIIWLDPKDQSIYRYDPQISNQAKETKPIDSAVKAFFAEILPSYTYFGNTLPATACIQDVRWKQRGHLDCFCQEYTLLYAWNRLAGMSHCEAAMSLVEKEEQILDEIKDFYAYMCIS